MEYSLTIFVLVVSLSPGAFSLFDPDNIIADTVNGRLQGMDVGESYVFAGVRFGKPPLRFYPPEPVEPWENVQPAKTFGIGCYQSCGGPSTSCPWKITEDCLFLNIYVPKDIHEDPTPRGVFFFVHGGNFQTGAGGVPLYDGRYLVNETGMIVVTINYRLEAFGFLYLGEIYDPDTGATVKHANYGMLDQRLALRYVKDNIAAFGGDPNWVTLAGQSAGAQSVGLHLLAAESDPLFQQAFMISNPFGLPYKLPGDAAIMAEYFAEELGCPPVDIACFRAKDADSVLAASKAAHSRVVNPQELFQFFEQWNPTVGEGEYPEEPVMAYEQGLFQKKRTVAGTVTEEGRAYVYGVFRNAVPWYLYRIFIRAVVPDYGQDVIRKYPPETLVDDQREVLNRLVTDYLFLCASSHVSQMMAKYGVEVYNYANDASFSFEYQWEGLKVCYGYPCHGGDLVYIFRSAPLANESFTPGEQNMVDAMTAYIGNFVRTGNPNTPIDNSMRQRQQKNLSYWPRVDEKAVNTTYTMYWSACKNSLVGNYRKDNCDFLDSFGYYQILYLNSFPDGAKPFIWQV